MLSQDVEITRRKPKQKRSQQTKNIILEAAAHILVKDQSQFSTNHIARCAGVSVGSLYQYFATKEDIIGELLVRQMDADIELFRNAFAQHEGSNLDELIEAVVEVIIESHRCNLGLRLALQQQASLPHGLCSLVEHSQKLLELVILELKKRQDQINPELDLAFTATLICKAVEGIIVHLMNHEPERLHQNTTLSAMTRLIFRYLAKAQPISSMCGF